MPELYAKLIMKHKKKLVETDPRLWDEIRDILSANGLDDDGYPLNREEE